MHPIHVAILGASPNPTRYAYLAAQRLRAAGHRVTGIHPQRPEVLDLELVATVPELPPGIHTLTIYVAPERSLAWADAIVSYGFARVIFNPGSENPDLERRLRDAGVAVEQACTLVMLSTGEF